MKVQRSLQPREGFGGTGGSKLISPNGKSKSLGSIMGLSAQSFIVIVLTQP